MTNESIVRLAAVDEDLLLGAAYAMTESAYVLVERKGRGGTVRLWPKKKTSASALAAEFHREYENQRLRWALARGGMGLRVETLRRALTLAEAAGGRPQTAQTALSRDQKAEIAALLAEAEADRGPRDPLGIAQPWEEGRKDR